MKRMLVVLSVMVPLTAAADPDPGAPEPAAPVATGSVAPVSPPSSAPVESDPGHGRKVAGEIFIGVGSVALASATIFGLWHLSCHPDDDCQIATEAYGLMSAAAALVALPIGIGLYMSGQSRSRRAAVSLAPTPHGGSLVLLGRF